MLIASSNDKTCFMTKVVEGEIQNKVKYFKKTVIQVIIVNN